MFSKLGIAIIDEYKKLSIAKRMQLFDELLYSELSQLENKVILKFINSVILDERENSYIRKRALEELRNLNTLGIIKSRNILSTLIDNWADSEDTFLELSRIKILAQYYTEEKDDIRGLLLNYMKSDDMELVNESHFHLGFISISEALDSDSMSSMNNHLRIAQGYFHDSLVLDPNRIDSEICNNICLMLESCMTNNINLMDSTFKLFTELLFKKELFSFRRSTLFDFEVGVYRSLFNIRAILKSNVSEWLDYRCEIEKLSYYINEIRDNGFSSSELTNDMYQKIHGFAIEKSIEPFTYNSFATQKSKLKVLRQEYEVNSKEYETINYLFEVIDSFEEDDNVSLDVKTIQNMLPDIDNEDAESLINGVRSKYELNRILVSLGNASLSNEKLLNSVIFSCIRLQRNVNYTVAYEDDRNTYIADLIEATGFITKDQPFWGKSFEGKSSGEVDILVLDSKRVPISIIEALNLDSLRKDYLNDHIDKVYKYDTTGLSNNYILVYSNAKNFSSFWGRYLNHVKNHNYKYKLKSLIKDETFEFTDIRLCIGTHDRNGKDTKLIHIVVNMNK